MEQKTNVNAEDGKQEVTITRDFDLPVDLLFKAHAEAGLIEQWMGTKVLRLESRPHGSYEFETTHEGKVVFHASGVIHAFVPNQKITRTFEMDNAPFGVQLEFYEFEQRSPETSKLRIHVLYESVAQRDAVLKQGLPWALNMVHDRMEQIVKQLI